MGSFPFIATFALISISAWADENTHDYFYKVMDGPDQNTSFLYRCRGGEECPDRELVYTFHFGQNSTLSDFPDLDARYKTDMPRYKQERIVSHGFKIEKSKSDEAVARDKASIESLEKSAHLNNPRDSAATKALKKQIIEMAKARHEGYEKAKETLYQDENRAEREAMQEYESRMESGEKLEPGQLYLINRRHLKPIEAEEKEVENIKLDGKEKFWAGFEIRNAERKDSEENRAAERAAAAARQAEYLAGTEARKAARAAETAKNMAPRRAAAEAARKKRRNDLEAKLASHRTRSPASHSSRVRH